MLERERGFPDYDRPPVIEVALSVQVDPLTKLDPAHIGHFWSTVKERFPVVRSAPPIPPTPDDFRTGGHWLPPQLQLQLSDRPVSRVQMVSADDQWMWQLQPDRFVVNWRKRDEEYPRYGRAKERFEEGWRSWQGFLSSNDFGPISPRFWQVTYVNRIPAGESELWQSPSQWPEVCPGLWGGELPELQLPGLDGVDLHGLRGTWVWDFAAPRSRLSIDARPSRPGGSDRDLLIDLRAWGPMPETPEQSPGSDPHLQSILAGLDRGRELIVKAFDVVTSDRAQQHWGRDDH